MARLVREEVSIRALRNRMALGFFRSCPMVASEFCKRYLKRSLRAAEALVAPAMFVGTGGAVAFAGGKAVGGTECFEATRSSPSRQKKAAATNSIKLIRNHVRDFICINNLFCAANQETYQQINQVQFLVA